MLPILCIYVYCEVSMKAETGDLLSLVNNLAFCLFLDSVNTVQSAARAYQT